MNPFNDESRWLWTDGAQAGGTRPGGESVDRAVRTALRCCSTVATASAFAVAVTLSASVSAQTRLAEADAADGLPTLGEVVVTARREALIDADERKKTSESIVDSIVADEAGLLPDNSVTEVLQRVSGVTIVRFGALGDPDHYSAEGSGIQVRGLSGVAARLNGREVFSATSAGGLSFGDVTPELLQAVDVYKSATADLIEGGSGGQVDLRTKMPFDMPAGLHLQASASGNYGDLAKKVDPGASFMVSDRWRGAWGEFGALVDLAYSKLDQKDFFIRNEPYYKTNINNTDYYIPGGYDYGFDQFERTRKGAYVGLQWTPSDTLSLAETLFYSKYQTTGSGDGAFITSKILAVDPTQSTFDANNGLVKSPNVFTRNTGTFAAGGGSMYATGDAGVSQSYSDTLDVSSAVEWKPTEHWDVKGAFQFVNSIADRKTYDLFDTPPSGNGGYALTESSERPDITQPSAILNQYADPANYVWSAHQDHDEHHDGQERAVNLDLKYNISETGFLRSAQIGGRYADRTEVDADSGYNWSAFCKGWNGCNPVSLAAAPTQPGDVSYQPFSNFFRGSIQVPGGLYLPSQNFAATYDPLGNVAQLGGGLTIRPNGSVQTPYTFYPEMYSNEKSINTAGYGLVRFANDSGLPFDGSFGVRVVKVENKSQGDFNQSAISVGNALLYPLVSAHRAGGRTTDRALPAFNIRLKPTEEFFIRAAYTLTLDEPSFFDLRGNGISGATVVTKKDANNNIVSSNITYNSTSGNPDLRPAISHNTDLSFEWYPKSSTSAHLSLFYKTINDTIVYGNTVQPFPFVQANGTTIIQPTSVQADFNAPGKATIKGLELGGRTFFDRLPAPLNGLGVEANYTHLNDNNPGDQYVDISGVLHNNVPIVGLSNNSYNAVLMFEKTQWSGRLAYNWRSKYLMTTNSNGTNGSYSYYSGPGAAAQLIGISLPIYAAAYGELDFGVTYRPTSHLSVSLDLKNVTNATVKTLMGGYPNGAEYVRSWFTADRRILLSAAFKL